MVLEPTIPLYEEVVNGFDKLLATDESAQETSDLRRARKAAFEKFRANGFPTIKEEDWKYTNIARFLKDEYDLSGGVPKNAAQLLDHPAFLESSTIPGFDCYRIVLVNGTWMNPGPETVFPSGLHVHTIAETRKDPTLSAYLEKYPDFGELHFVALNAALFSDGLYIRVDPGFVPDKPLHIVHVYTGDRNLLVQPRHVVMTGRHANLTIIESVVREGGADDPKILANSLTEIFIEPDAHVEHFAIQTPGASTRLIQHTTVRQRRQSVYNHFVFTMPGNELVRNELHIRLEEENAEAHLYGLYLSGGRQLVDNHTLVDHQKPSCQSNELYKGVLLEQATGVFNGKIYVHKDAQKTNAFQQNNNLVISKQATIDSKPQLEIFADDVKCSHGSTVGQFSEEALFYLRSRGIGEEAAKGLLINAFAFDVTERIRIPALRAHINRLITDHIPTGM